VIQGNDIVLSEALKLFVGDCFPQITQIKQIKGQERFGFGVCFMAW
jgi:hypothetical protein